ncbi:DUF1330 domain-containing protein [Thalassiella azotivora]
MGSVHPRPEVLQALAGRFDARSPLVMLNLLRFRHEAAYPAGSPHPACSGREAYARYARVAGACVAALGGNVLYAGAAEGAVIAPDGEEWDEVLLVRYPSVGAFLGMLQDEDYLAATVHRTAALADSRLVATRPAG